MKKYHTTFCITLLMLLMGACDFGDTNIDPGLLRDVDARNILPATLAQSARNIGAIGPRVTGTVIQHFKGTNAQSESYTTYTLDEGVIDDYWRSGLYGGAMKDCNIIVRKAASVDMPHYRGIAKVLMAFNLGITTSFWGDVPYSDAFQNEAQMKPLYDSQEDIYQSIQRLLDEAIEDFGRSPGDFSPKEDDLVFGGNIARWVATARALKARYYMHLTRVDPEAHTRALVVLSQGSISSNDTQPDFPFESGSLNTASPLAYFLQERADQLILGDYLKNLMVSFSDPRLPMYGVKSGDDYEIYSNAASSKLFWAKNETPLALISYTEVKFIEAEAYLRSGDDVKAQSTLTAAITSNMVRLGVATAAYQAYVASYALLTGTLEEKLERVMIQKYIAMYGQGVVESWVDYRRTGYPALTLPEDVEPNQSFFTGDPVIPRRYLYPQSERTTNGAHWKEAIDRQGGHLLDNDLWAFKQQ